MQSPPLNVIDLTEYDKLKSVLDTVSSNKYKVTILNNNIYKINAMDSDTYRILAQEFPLMNSNGTRTKIKMKDQSK